MLQSTRTCYLRNLCLPENLVTKENLNDSKKWGIAAVSIIAIGIIAYLVSNFSPKTKRVYTGFKGEARINSLLAAGIFEHTGHRVQSFSTFSMANLREDYVSAIICPISALPKTKVEIEFLEEWLELGGHLITGIRQKGHINSDTFPEELKKILKVKEIIPDAYEETIQAISKIFLLTFNLK